MIDVFFVEGEEYERDLAKLETKVWSSDHELQDRQIDQFLILARYVPID